MNVTVNKPCSTSCGLATVKLACWLHKKTASFRNSTHCTVWTRQLLSARYKQTDGERRQKGRGEMNVGDMKICEGAREQSRTCETTAVSFFVVALL